MKNILPKLKKRIFYLLFIYKKLFILFIISIFIVLINYFSYNNSTFTSNSEFLLNQKKNLRNL